MTTWLTRADTIDWVELTTPDMQGASSFYQRVLGWTYTSLGGRSLAEIGGHKAAGIAPHIPTIGDTQLPATWTVFIRAADLERTLRRATELGGVVIEPPEDIPEGWRTAVMLDPTGASFALVQASADFGFDAPGQMGGLAWCDLLTRKPSAAEAFYRALLGWEAEFDARSGHTTFSVQGRHVAGMLDMPPGLPADAPSQWLPYFRVESAEVACRLVTERDGTVEVAPQPMDSMVFAVVRDPGGALFGLLESRQAEIEGEPAIEDESPNGEMSGVAAAHASLGDRVVAALREGNRRHIVVRDRYGRQMVELPVNLGVVAVLVAPFATAAGALAAVASRWSIAVSGDDRGKGA
ncbi:MAG: VOC family protein [Actinomycetota bacterium]